MIRAELSDDFGAYVGDVVARVLREWDGMDPGKVPLDRVQEDLDVAFMSCSARPVVCLRDGRLVVEFV